MKIRNNCHKSFVNSLLLSGIWIGSLAVAAPVLAQEATPKADAPAIADIVVTAQRRSESSQSVPTAVTAFDSKALAKIGFSAPTDVAAIVPSVQVQEIYGKFQPIFSIRGISQSSYSANQTSPVGVYADEAYIGETFLQGANFFDTERVEVLEGPQGTLYGKNTTGGAVNVISRAPKIDDTIHANVAAGYGNYQAVTLDGGVEGTLVPGKLAVRVAAFYDNDEGYQRIVNFGTRAAKTNGWGVRGTIVYRPVDNLNFVLRYTHTNTNDIPNMARAIGLLPYGPQGQLEDFSGYYRPASLGPRDFEGDIAHPYLKISANFVTLASTLNLPGFDIVSVSAYHASNKAMLVDIGGDPNGLADQGFNNRTHAFSEDIRLVTTGNGPVKLIVGGYWGSEQNAQSNTYNLYQGTLAGLNEELNAAYGPATGDYLTQFYQKFGYFVANQTLTHHSIAGYGELRWKVAPKVNLTAGLRFTHDVDGQNYYNISRYTAPGGTPLGSYIPGNITAGTANPVDAAFDPGYTMYINGPFTNASAPYLGVANNRVTGKFTADYKPTKDAMVYATYSRGYRSGNFDAGLHYLFDDASIAYAKPETIDDYEIGLKTDWFNHRLRFNAGAFEYIYTNQQFENVEGIATILVNAGKSKLQGEDAELQIAPARGLTISLSGMHLHARYESLTLEGFNLAGNQLISAPTWSGTASIDYATPVASGFVLNFHADGNARSHQWYSAFNGQDGYGNIGQNGYAIVNGRIALVSDKGYELSLWTKNLFNRLFTSYAINIQSAYGMDYQMDGPPRTFGVELKYHF